MEDFGHTGREDVTIKTEVAWHTVSDCSVKTEASQAPDIKCDKFTTKIKE